MIHVPCVVPIQIVKTKFVSVYPNIMAIHTPVVDQSVLSIQIVLVTKPA